MHHDRSADNSGSFQKGKIQLMITISLIAKTFANGTCGERSKRQLFRDVKQKTIRKELCE